MSFWDIVWFIVISFAFVAYLMVLFQIVGDLFRDPGASGFEKAAWMIAKGRGMAERQMHALQEAKSQQDAYIREVASNGASPADQIAQAKSMVDAGTISPAEYERLKEKALA